MSSPFVRFPSGNYVFTDDVNLFDSDTAHGVQSIGLWASEAFATGFQVVSDTGAFGENAIQFGRTSTGSVTVKIRNQDSPTSTGAPVTAGTTYTGSIYLKQTVGTPSGTFKIRLRWWNAANSNISTTDGATETITSGFTQASVTGVAPVGAVAASFTVEVASADAADIYLIDKTTLREGSDATFLPSLRIVGDLDLRARIAADDYTAAGNQSIMSDWNGDGCVLYVDTSGHLHFEGDGTTGSIDEASSLFTFVDGAATEVRVTLDVSAGNMVWYQDGVQVDTDTFTAQPLDPGGRSLIVGADYLGTGLLFAGDIYWAERRDGIDGPVVARFDSADVAAVL
jgi:hypothetical protein